MDVYNTQIAQNYSSYRPPLHKEILINSIPTGTEFRRALDIGCGTGISSVALLDFCDAIIGIDPSSEMIDLVKPQERISYFNWDLNNEQLSDERFDLFSMAGCLYYIKSQEMINRITDLSSEKAIWIIYDFLVNMDDVYRVLNLPTCESEYDHKVDLSGLDHSPWRKERQEQQILSFHIKAEELAHLLLSEEHIQSFLENKYIRNFDSILMDQINALFSDKESIELNAMTYTTIYKRQVS